MSRKRLSWMILVLGISMLLVAACTPATPAEPGSTASQSAGTYTQITAVQLAERLENKDFTLVNVHIPYAGEIPQTDLHIPFDALADNQDALPDINAPIVIYCRSGSMSASAMQTLQELGYTNVTDVRGGMRAWEAAGYELVRR